MFVQYFCYITFLKQAKVEEASGCLKYKVCRELYPACGVVKHMSRQLMFLEHSQLFEVCQKKMACECYSKIKKRPIYIRKYWKFLVFIQETYNLSMIKVSF